MNTFFSPRTGLVALALIASWQVPLSSAQTSCPLPPTPPSAAEANACEACLKGAVEKVKQDLAGDSVKAFIAAGGALAKARAACAAGLALAVTALNAAANVKMYMNVANCKSTACSKIVAYADSVKRYEEDAKKASSGSQQAKSPSKFVTCYFEEKSSSASECPSQGNYHFRLKMGNTASSGIPGNSTDYHLAHFSCGPWKCGKARDSGISSPTCVSVNFAEKCQ